MINVFLIVSCCRSGQGIELDLFLLQCCAALAPPDLFVNRIIERFGLSNYLSLNLERSNEYVLISLISILYYNFELSDLNALSLSGFTIVLC